MIETTSYPAIHPIHSFPLLSFLHHSVSVHSSPSLPDLDLDPESAAKNLPRTLKLPQHPPTLFSLLLFFFFLSPHQALSRYPILLWSPRKESSFPFLRIFPSVSLGFLSLLVVGLLPRAALLPIQNSLLLQVASSLPSPRSSQHALPSSFAAPCDTISVVCGC